MGLRVSIYNILKVVNIIIIILTIWIFSTEGANHYINEWSVVLNAILVVISNFVLTDAKKNNNPLLSILAFVMILHYELRVFSLDFTGYSYPFKNTISIDNHGVNSIITYCIISYLFCWGAFHYSEKKVKKD